MTTTTTSAALIPVAPVFTNTERLALAGFLAGYSGLTREAYALDLRQYASWCHQHHLRLFQARRADIECFARDLEAGGRARAPTTRRLCTIAGFYKYAVEEELPGHSPAARVIQIWEYRARSPGRCLSGLPSRRAVSRAGRWPSRHPGRTRQPRPGPNRDLAPVPVPSSAWSRPRTGKGNR